MHLGQSAHEAKHTKQRLKMVCFVAQGVFDLVQKVLLVSSCTMGSISCNRSSDLFVSALPGLCSSAYVFLRHPGDLRH